MGSQSVSQSQSQDPILHYFILYFLLKERIGQEIDFDIGKVLQMVI